MIDNYKVDRSKDFDVCKTEWNGGEQIDIDEDIEDDIEDDIDNDIEDDIDNDIEDDIDNDIENKETAPADTVTLDAPEDVEEEEESSFNSDEMDM